jgi:hypothetical protein
MSHRSFLVALGALFAGLVALPGQEKKADPAPAPVAIPATVPSDYVLFAHLNVKDIRDGAVFAEVKRAVAKAGGPGEWDRVEEQLGKKLELGIKPSEIEAVTVCVAEVTARGDPKFALILTATKPIPRTGGLFALVPGDKPDERGFYKLNDTVRAHFPDDKTMAILHADVAEKYLDGYAKTRTGWPLTADLSKAAAGHTVFLALRPDRFPAEMRTGRDAREFGSLFAARAVTFTADLKGKELSVAARATFADATAAGKARHKVHAVVGLVSDGIDELLAGKADLGGLRVPVKEAERALAATRIETDGADLIASARYTADFDFGAFAIEAVKRVRRSAAELTATNNLKQIVLSLINHADTNTGKMPIHGIGPKGLPLQKADDKPLLSWRVAVLPYMEQLNLYNQFKLDEPWDSEANKKLIEKMPKVFAPVAKPGKPGYTHLQMVVGPKALRLPSAQFPATFQDGTSNTIAVVEAAEPVVWTKPDDVMFPDKEFPKNFRKRFGGQFPGGFYAAMWDGSVRFVPDSVTDQTLGFALCPDDGMVLGPDW